MDRLHSSDLTEIGERATVAAAWISSPGFFFFSHLLSCDVFNLSIVPMPKTLMSSSLSLSPSLLLSLPLPLVRSPQGVDNSGDVYRATYTAFRCSRVSGTLGARQKMQVMTRSRTQKQTKQNWVQTRQHSLYHFILPPIWSLGLHFT